MAYIKMIFLLIFILHNILLGYAYETEVSDDNEDDGDGVYKEKYSYLKKNDNGKNDDYETSYKQKGINKCDDREVETYGARNEHVNIDCQYNQVLSNADETYENKRMHDKLPSYDTRYLLQIYINGKMASPGQRVGLTDLVNPPYVRWDCWVCPPESTYKLVMYEADGVGTIEGQKFVFWMVTTRQCDTKGYGLVSPFPYKPPTAAPGTGFHRYVFVLYCVDGSSTVADSLDRTLFFPENHGEPAATNFLLGGVLPGLNVLPEDKGLPI